MSGVQLRGLSKAYGQNRVLRGVSWQLEAGARYCLMAASGSGKTTLLRVMLGLEQPDAGSVQGMEPGCVSAMFQEDRLCEALTPVENVLLVMPRGTGRAGVRRMLAEILPPACLGQPVCELSGGMRRRVALARAMAFPGSVVVLDEPFTGLDVETRKRAICFVLRHQRGRTLLVATHGLEDARLLDAECVTLDQLQEEGELS